MCFHLICEVLLVKSEKKFRGVRSRKYDAETEVRENNVSLLKRHIYQNWMAQNLTVLAGHLVY